MHTYTETYAYYIRTKHTHYPIQNQNEHIAREFWYHQKYLVISQTETKARVDADDQECQQWTWRLMTGNYSLVRCSGKLINNVIISLYHCARHSCCSGLIGPEARGNLACNNPIQVKLLLLNALISDRALRVNQVENTDTETVRGHDLTMRTEKYCAHGSAVVHQNTA